MPHSPIPDPLNQWSKWAVEVVDALTPGGKIAEVYRNFLQFYGAIKAADAPDSNVWMHVQMTGQKVAGTDPRERFVTTMDIVNITGGAVDASWTTADFTAVVGQLTNIMTAWAPMMSATWQWVDVRFYQRSFNPYSISEPFTKSGPPVHITPFALVGTGGLAQAPQVAITSTDLTTFPRHWGRNYWPHAATGTSVNPGLVLTGTVDALATAVHDAYAALGSGQFFPVVVSTQVNKLPTRALLGITGVQVDNVFDVIRRRRAPIATYRKVIPVPTFQSLPAPE